MPVSQLIFPLQSYSVYTSHLKFGFRDKGMLLFPVKSVFFLFFSLKKEVVI